MKKKLGLHSEEDRQPSNSPCQQGNDSFHRIDDDSLHANALENREKKLNKKKKKANVVVEERLSENAKETDENRVRKAKKRKKKPVSSLPEESGDANVAEDDASGASKSKSMKTSREAMKTSKESMKKSRESKGTSRESMKTSRESKGTSRESSGTNDSHTTRKELHDLAKELWPLVDVETVKGAVRQMIKQKRMLKTEAGDVVRLWRRHRRQFEHRQSQREQCAKELGLCDTLVELKNKANSMVDAGNLGRCEAAEIIRHWKLRDARRLRRQEHRSDREVCFHCRQPGHRVADCTQQKDSDLVAGLCFKCGSTEHTSGHCPRKTQRGFPYATCFICRRQGHLSRDCEQNLKGIYPEGGACDLCGSQQHLKKDCPCPMKPGDAQMDDAQMESPEMTHRASPTRIVRF